jgi:membrane protease subunit HflK
VAQGEADRFSKVLAESSKAPDATRRRLYLELLGELLPKLGRKVVVGKGDAVDLSLFADEATPAKPKGDPGR